MTASAMGNLLQKISLSDNYEYPLPQRETAYYYRTINLSISYPFIWFVVKFTDFDLDI